jgi:hypothetical protein
MKVFRIVVAAAALAAFAMLVQTQTTRPAATPANIADHRLVSYSVTKRTDQRA